MGGALLLAATAAALVWANSPAAGAYFGLRDLELGYEPWHLRLSVGHWASDGLLAIFFFIAGLELKREFVSGELRRPSRAIVPVAAAMGGVAVPALIYAAITWSQGAEALRGWAIPTATDIAFALAVLAVINTHLPAALRTFLLTLAVVDDLIAIGIIAFFYSAGLQPFFLLAALVPLALFALLVQKRISRWYLLVPLAAATWALVHASGIHATVAGVLLGFTVPVSSRGGTASRREPGPPPAMATDKCQAWPNAWSTRCGRSRRASPCPSSPSSPPASRSAEPPGSASALADPVAAGNRGCPGRGQGHRRLRCHLRGHQNHPGKARRGAEVDRRRRPVHPRRGGLHGVPAHRGAELRRRFSARRPRQGGHPGRLSDRIGDCRRRAEGPKPALPPGGGRRKSGTTTATACLMSSIGPDRS